MLDVTHIGICHYIIPTSCWCSVISGGARVWADDPERISWVVWWASLIIVNTSFNISSQTSFWETSHHNICKHIKLWRLGECTTLRSPVIVGAFIEMEGVYPDYLLQLTWKPVLCSCSQTNGQTLCEPCFIYYHYNHWSAAVAFLTTMQGVVCLL